MREAPAFDFGDRVKIIPLENIDARVIGLELDRDGWTITCRYFENGDAKSVKLFTDEVVKA